MASGIARGRVRKTATESSNLAAILQTIGWQRQQPWFTVYLLCPIDTCQNKVSADQHHVTISRAQVYNSSRSCVFSKLTADQVLVFDWIAANVRLTCWKQGSIVRKLVNASPGLKFIRIITLSSMQMLFVVLFCVYKTQNSKNTKLKSKILPSPGLA